MYYRGNIYIVPHLLSFTAFLSLYETSVIMINVELTKNLHLGEKPCDYILVCLELLSDCNGLVQTEMSS